MGGVSDSYNPKEKELKLSRNALELINAFNFGVCIITKSNLVTRDTDILLDIKEHSPTSVNFSITCSDNETCKKIEPFVSTTKERFEAIEYLSKNGITTGVLMDPVIPYITDTIENVQEMVKKAKYYGANYIYLSTQVTMADVQRDYFLHEAEKHYPGISEKFLQRYKNYYHCWSFNGKKLWNSFVETCEKENMNYDMRAANQRLRSGYNSIQYTLKLY
jgi:DNA repair photolyase